MQSSLPSLPTSIADDSDIARFSRAGKHRFRDSHRCHVSQGWPWWQWPHLLSLDAPAVAVTWLWWWASRRNVRLPANRFVILGLCVWAIYVADRLADAAGEGVDDWPSDRHLFHAIHRRRLTVALCGALVGLGLLVCSSLPPWQFFGGLGLLGLVTFYYWVIHRAPRAFLTLRLPVSKDSAVGGLFALGTSVFLLGTRGVEMATLLFQATMFGALCFFNCALITVWERRRDGLQKETSSLRAVPCMAANLRSVALSLGFISVLAALTFAKIEPLPVVLSTGALWTLNLHHESIDPGVLRVLADLALLTPWLVAAIL